MITPETIDRLKAQLLTSGLSQQNQPLFQIINLLIDALRQGLTASQIVLGGPGGGPTLGSQTFLTAGDETGSLPNSRQLTAGIGIQFDDSIGGLRAISIFLDTGVTPIDGTVGSVLFIGPGPVIAEDNANFFWNDTNNRLGIGTNVPQTDLDIQRAAGAGIFLGRNPTDKFVFIQSGAPSGYTIDSFAIWNGITGPYEGLILQFRVDANLVFNRDVPNAWTTINGFHTTNPSLTISQVSALTNAVRYIESLSHVTSGSVAPGFGVGVQYTIESGSGFPEVAGTLEVIWTTATNNLEDADFIIKLMKDGAVPTEAFRVKDTGYIQWQGQKRVSTKFDNTNATLANVTGLSVNVGAGRTYTFRAVLFVDADAVGGHKYAIAGTATATAIIYQIDSIRNDTNAFVINSRQIALAGAAGAAGGTTIKTIIEGTITVSAGGTLTVQFAQNAANGTSSVLIGSFLEVNEVL